MKKSFIPILLLIISFLICCGQEKQKSNYHPVTKFDPNRDAAKDLEDAIKEATDFDKRIILDVGGEWCPWCHKLDAFIEGNKDIKEFIAEHYVMLKINYSKENKNDSLLSAYPEIPGYPHYFVLDSDGNFLHSQGTAELEFESSYSLEKIMEFFEKWIK
ncbi:MAG: thioredoxin family protein [Ignavibacteriales bacterium]|nr:thioredoxin family protein [Ignavibacteriales bacterium]